MVRAYHRVKGIPTEQLELPNMSILDKWFEIAENALDGLDKTLPPSRKDMVEDAEFKDMPSDNSVEWEKQWEDETGWCSTSKDNAHHAFRKKQSSSEKLLAVCTASFSPHELTGKVKSMEHGMRLICCTSCVIGVMR